MMTNFHESIAVARLLIKVKVQVHIQ